MRTDEVLVRCDFLRALRVARLLSLLNFVRPRVRGFRPRSCALLFVRQVAREYRSGAFEERAQGCGVERGDGEAFARADFACLSQHRFEVGGLKQVGFVEDDEARDVRVSEFAQDSLDRFELLLPARRRGVNEVYEQVALRNLFERGAEGRDEIGRKVAYETDGV